PVGFRFCAKLPREISQAENLHEVLDLALTFRRLLTPLGARVTPFWLQLPASFGPGRLAELAALIDGFGAPLAVEVRHRAFFERGEEERALNRLLLDRGVERICLDSRALFSCRSRDPALLHAQSKKPRVPVRPTAFSWLRSTFSWLLGLIRSRAGSRPADLRMSTCTSPTTTGRRNWRSASMSNWPGACRDCHRCHPWSVRRSYPCWATDLFCKTS